MVTAAATIKVDGQRYRQARRAPWPLRATWWCLRRGIPLILFAVLWAGRALLAVTRATGKAVRAVTVGRNRARWAPLLFALAVVVPVPGGTLLWLALAVAAALRPCMPTRDRLPAAVRWLVLRRQHLSAREARLVSRACALAGWWHDVAPLLPVRSAATLLAVLTLACATPWWWGRRVRVSPGQFPDIWRQHVVPRLPKTDGAFVQWDQDAGRGVLELHDALASEVAKMDSQVEMALDQAGFPMRRGMINLVADPGLTVRQVSIILHQSPEARADRWFFWDGPTLRADGRFVMARYESGAPVWVMLRDVENGRARHFSWDGPTSTGKGGSMRLTIVEAAIHEFTEPLIADGKWGAGLGYCRAATLSYAATPEAVADQADRIIQVLRMRATRYGVNQWDSFTAGPGEPHLPWVIDELPQILKSSAGRKVAAAIKEIAEIGGSLGISVLAAKQRGDAASWGFGIEATTARTNIAGGGGRWIGPSDDDQGDRSNKQRNSSLDSAKLPRNGGWCYIIDRNPNPPPSRGLWLPNRRDRDVKGRPAPHGVIEEWLERDTVHPVLRDDEHEVLFARPLAGTGPELEALDEQPTGDQAPGRERATLVSPLAGASETSREDAVIKALPGPGEEGKTRHRIGATLRQEGISITDRHVSKILSRLAGKTPPAAINDNGKWRKAS